MTNINVGKLQKDLDEACNELINVKRESKELAEAKLKEWQPIATLIDAHRKDYSGDKKEVEALEKELKDKVKDIYDKVKDIRKDVHEQTLLAKKENNMDKVKELTLLLGELSLRVQAGVIMQQDWDIDITFPKKLDIEKLLENPKIRELVESELKREIKKNPNVHIPGITKRYFSCVKVREGQQKRL